MSAYVQAPQGFHDFDMLPRKDTGQLTVLPTPAKLLIQGGDILVYREVRRTPTTPTGVSRAQNRLFHHLVTMGEHPDTPCRFTVLCVWGPPGEEREMCVYDHMVQPPDPPAWLFAPDPAIPTFIRDWFHERTGR